MKKVSKNYCYNIIYQILTLIIPLITTPYISRVLSVDGIGLYSFTYSIAYFFTIAAELGTVTYARREIAYCQDDKEKRSIIFWEILILRILTSIISIFIYIIYTLNSNYMHIAIIQSLYILTVVFDVTWFFQGMENFKSVVLKNCFVKLVMVIFIFAFVKTENDLNIYIFALAFLPMLGNIIIWPSLFKDINKICFSKLKPLRHLKGTLTLFIPTIASQVYLLLDKTMLGFFTVNNIENGYYEQSQKIIRMCWTFLTTFSAVMAPRISYYISKNEKKQLKKYINISFEFVWILSIGMCFGLIGISDNLVPWFFGEEYKNVSILLKIFAIILLPIGINGVTGTQYLVSIRKQKIYTYSIIIGAIINFILNIILIPKFFSIGAAISSVVAEYIITTVQVIYVCLILKHINLNDIFSEAWKSILSGVIMLIFLNILSTYLVPNMLNSFILIIVGISIYMIMQIILKNRLIYLGIKKILKYKNKLL